MAKLGVCYYPEHWPEGNWSRDAKLMADAGIAVVRIGEFAWSRLEPEPGQYDFEWLSRAMDTLANANLTIVLGTPTAAPPKWLVDRLPDMLPVDAAGRTRGFGSRRHYCFSHTGYQEECARIVSQLAQTFGEHPALVAWQTDNEYGCHDTTLSYSQAARQSFLDWLRHKYGTIEKLNDAWGTVFWSMTVHDFDEIELPSRSVTEVNPAHAVDFRRFSSEQVVRFNKLQVDIIRRHSPGRDIIHNYMGRILDFDHFAVGRDLDIAAWDSYPLGFLEDRSDRCPNWKARFKKAGDPDFQAFHHDLYRSVGRGRWWVMEQQPGPVNWAPHNPAPREGTVRLWSLEAFAHGAEVVSYFRWRQLPFGQEQMHAGLLRPDGQPAPGFEDAAQTGKDLAALPTLPATGASDIAIIFDYESAWAWTIQPQGQSFDYFALAFDVYRHLRALGLGVDFVEANCADLSAYSAVFIPGLFAWPQSLLTALANYRGLAVVGPRTGSKTVNFRIPDDLPPNLPADLLDARVVEVESLSQSCSISIISGGEMEKWFEHVELGNACQVLESCIDGRPAVLRQSNLVYLCGWPDDQLMAQLMKIFTDEAELATVELPDGVRMRRRGETIFVFNYGDDTVDMADLGLDDLGQIILGDRILPPSGVSVISTREAGAA